MRVMDRRNIGCSSQVLIGCSHGYSNLCRPMCRPPEVSHGGSLVWPAPPGDDKICLQGNNVRI